MYVEQLLINFEDSILKTENSQKFPKTQFFPSQFFFFFENLFFENFNISEDNII
jgi:hypothetical protein